MSINFMNFKRKQTNLMNDVRKKLEIYIRFFT